MEGDTTVSFCTKCRRLNITTECQICKDLETGSGTSTTSGTALIEQEIKYASILKDYEKSLREIYELGVSHGRELQKKDTEIEEFEKGTWR